MKIFNGNEFVEWKEKWCAKCRARVRASHSLSGREMESSCIVRVMMEAGHNESTGVVNLGGKHVKGLNVTASNVLCNWWRPLCDDKELFSVSPKGVAINIGKARELGLTDDHMVVLREYALKRLRPRKSHPGQICLPD